MKNRFNKIMLLAAIVGVFAACTKDETKVVIKAGSAPVLSLSAASVVLTAADADKTSTTASWTAATYGYDAAVTYTFQIDKKGNDFKNATAISVGSSLTKGYTVADLNTAALIFGASPNTAAQFDIRIRADVGETLKDYYLFSNVATLTVTPYLVVIQYPSLYVPGGYQGWAPEKAPKIASVKNDKNYEGYVNLPAAAEFKFTDDPSWNKGIFGDLMGGTTGNLTSPGDNMKVVAAGYYLLKADLTGKKWSATKTTWGIIGTSTPNGWDSDQPMTYDAVNDLWKITLNLKAGEFKFRANAAWDLNLGDDKADTILDYGGANMKIAADGNYTVSLILSTAGNYTFKVVKN